MNPESNHPVSEERQSLWLLAVSPAIWTVHFLFSYIGAAVWCGKVVGREGSLDPMRAAIAVTALLAVAGIAFTGVAGWRKHTHEASPPPHHEDTPEDRHRFLGYATVLLSCLSAVGTIYVALACIFIRSCV
ncbi:MAG TPA: hypothetical protein VM120_19210 [Bryobacteraceae bacterium]|nr:hypothetical protein [Bryobacteraceae bacterium]